MPEKSLEQRMGRAKAKGTTVALKAQDMGAAEALSPHAAKKSRTLAGRAGVGDRSVSPRRPPGRGKTTRGRKLPTAEAGGASGSRRKTLPAEAAAAYRKDGSAKQRQPSAPTRRAATPNGRKKPPSRMGVKRRGGPMKRSRLHGG